MSAEIAALSLAEARDAMAGAELSAIELVGAHVAQAEAARPLNAIICESFDRALDGAAASDARRAAGEAGALDGIPSSSRTASAPKGC